MRRGAFKRKRSIICKRHWLFSPAWYLLALSIRKLSYCSSAELSHLSKYISFNPHLLVVPDGYLSINIYDILMPHGLKYMLYWHRNCIFSLHRFHPRNKIRIRKGVHVIWIFYPHNDNPENYKSFSITRLYYAKNILYQLLLTFQWFNIS